MSSHTAVTLAYRLLILACTAGFAAYDLRTRRVPDKALLLFCPIVLAAPFLNALATAMAANPLTAQARPDCLGAALAAAHTGDTGASLCHFLKELPPSFLYSLAGAATGSLILFAAAMASADGCGVGGGDIKLAGAMGFVYGPSRMVAILLAASGLAAVTALFISHNNKHTNPKKKISLPFVPFLAAGIIMATVITAL